MDNKLQIFSNEQFGSIRTMELDGKPYFVGKDVAEVLGYSNSRKALIDHVDEEDKNDGVTIRDSIGREQKPIFINESGLYSLILSSKLPKAKEFKHWVTSEVLPAIRKTGSYTVRKQADTETAKTRAAAMMLNAKYRMANQMIKLWTSAGVEPQYQAMALNGYYDGLEIPRIAFKETAVALLDLTTIAQHLGVQSKSGKPHAQAVGAIIEKLQPLNADEWTKTPYSRNGHDGESIQYTQSVEDKVKNWLVENQYPTTISNQSKNFTIKYLS